MEVGASPRTKRAIGIGSRLEPFVDDHLVDTMEGLTLKLHSPIPRDRAIVFDKPWGGLGVYITVFQDDDRYRMYYGGGPPHGRYVAYAESRDGKTWVEPDLGLVSFRGSKKNSLILDDTMWPPAGSQAFAAFRDTNPDCAPEARYKALNIAATAQPAADLNETERREWGVGWTNALFAFKSPDGLHWTRMRKAPVLTKGSFDSQNTAFWDSVRQRYVCFFREFVSLGGDVERSARDRHRVIKTATSADFVHWGPSELLDYGPGALLEQAYVNGIVPMPGAPHVFVGFPQRFIEGRETEPGYPHPDSGRPYTAPGGRVVQVSDTGFMTSRDGLSWRRWRDALLRPGLQPTRWAHPHNNNAVSWGIVTTTSDIPGTPDEWSIYSHENDHAAPEVGALRRFTVRQHGFVSVHAPPTHGQYRPGEVGSGEGAVAFRPRSWTGGQLVTKPLTFQGNALAINYSTSAYGIVLVEVQDVGGRPIEGYSLADSARIWGDHVDRVVSWQHGSDVSRLADSPVRLRFVLNDADLYSLQFRDRAH